MSSRPPVSPRNYSKPWNARVRSPRAGRKLKPNQLWSTKPRWQQNRGRQSTTNGWNADAPPPARHSEIGGHHEEQKRPRSRGTYMQAPYGHVIPIPPSQNNTPNSSRPSTSIGIRQLTQNPEVDDNDDNEQNEDNKDNILKLNATTEPKSTIKLRKHEPGSTVIYRRPRSPHQTYSEKSSKERQKIALIKLRSLYDGRSKFHEIYQQWDINRDGGIDVDEFQTQLHHHGFEWLTNDDVEGLFHRFVPEEKHSLDYKAFRDFMFSHAIEDTVWDSEFDPFKSDKNYGWKSARIKHSKKKQKVTNPNPWRRNSSLGE